MSITLVERIRINQLAGAARANLEDAGLWRWYTDMMEDHRISVKCNSEKMWVVTFDHVKGFSNVSFDAAVREVFQWAKGHKKETLDEWVENQTRATVGGK